MASLSEVILISVADARSTDNRLWAVERDLLVSHLELADAVLASNDVAKVTNVSDLLSWATMGLISWVVVWTSSLAALNQVTCQKVKKYINSLSR